MIRVQWLGWLLVGAVGCGDSDGGVGGTEEHGAGGHGAGQNNGGGGSGNEAGGAVGGSGGGGGDCVPPAELMPIEVPASCLADGLCEADGDCDGGTRCNTTLSPPQCVELYCGPSGSPCSDTNQCETGLECEEGLCRACDVCGDNCTVDFMSNTLHCGCCDNPVPEGGKCENGVPACITSSQSICDGVCVSLDSDAENCGVCGAQCINDSNCHLGTTCSLRGEERQSCTAFCEARGMECAPEGDHQASYFPMTGPCRVGTEEPLTCATIPPSVDGTQTCMGGTYENEFLRLYCYCLPIP